jgi:Icc-related predicted phosphoesterase
MDDEVELNHIWQKIPDDTNILITHGPAYMCLDKVNNTYGGDPHVGSKTLQNRKLELPNLKLHVSGHIHEAYGQVDHASYTNICASSVDVKYRLVNKPITMEL